MRDLYFVILPRLLLLDFAGPWQAFVEVNLLQAKAQAAPLFRLHVVGPNPDTALEAAGLALAGIAPLPEVLPADAVVLIPGVYQSPVVLEGPECMTLVAWLGRVLRPEHTLVTVCAGALVAARAGLLAGRQCTTHQNLVPHLARLAPTAKIRDDRIFVEDRGVFTSAGVTSGIDLALFLIGRWCGEPMALAVARELVVYLRRSGNDPQLSPWLAGRNHLESRVHKVQDAICRAPERRFSLEELADSVHWSVRHLTRVFREVTGMSLHDYQTRIHLDHAQRLLGDGGHSVERVAELAGFGSARSLRRAWNREYGLPPSRHAAAGNA